MTLTVLVTGLVKAYAADTAPEGEGCDIAAGLIGPNVSEWLRDVAATIAAPVPSNGWPDTDKERSAPVAPAEPPGWAETQQTQDKTLADVVEMLGRQHEWLTKIAAINLVAGLYGRAGNVLAAAPKVTP